MKVLYFTGTGNSYDVAARLGGDLFDMANTSDTEIADSIVGIVCPVYCNDIPDTVATFLDRTTIKADYIFVVITAGAATGNTYSSINMRLKKHGAQVSYAATLAMPDSCILFKTPIEKQKAQLAALPEKIEQMKQDILQGKRTEIAAKNCPTAGTKFMWFFMKHIFGIKNKRADTQTCIKCKKCEGCPVHNIKVNDSGVQFSSQCVNCFRCIQICPVNAIRFGRVKRTEASRYLNKNWLETSGRGGEK